jgi:hypothetical protein
MRIADVGGERILSLCGTVLNRLKLEHCAQCGAVLGPAKYHDYITRRLKGNATVVNGRALCMACARKISAKKHNEEIIPLG